MWAHIEVGDFYLWMVVCRNFDVPLLVRVLAVPPRVAVAVNS